MRKKLPVRHLAGAEEASRASGTGEAEQADTGPVPLLQVAGSDKGVGSTDSAQVDHCTVIGHLDRLPDAGLAAFQHLEFVHSVLHTQWQDFIPWKPLPERKHS